MTPASTEKDRHTRTMQLSPPTSQVKVSSSISRTRAKNDIPDLHMFLIRPSVQDDDETVKISWYLTETNVQRSDIRAQLAQYEHENQPSLLDTPKSLRAFERSLIEKINEHGTQSSADRSRYELIVLKRAYTTISHREMAFQGVPGLRFVVQQVPSQRQLVPTTKQPGMKKVSTTNGARGVPKRISSEEIAEAELEVEVKAAGLAYDEAARSRARKLPILRNPITEERAPEESREQQLRLMPDSPKPFILPNDAMNWGGRVEDQLTASDALPRMERAWQVSMGVSPEDETIDNAEEEQVIADLLGKYTTLYE